MPPEQDATQQHREKIVRRHMEAENELDFDAVIATFDHPRYELIGTDRVHDGEDSVRAYFAESRSAFPDQRNEIIALHHTSDGVIVEFWLLGTHQGALGSLAPTGKKMRVRMAAFFLFDGDKIGCERVYFDTASILKQLTKGA